MKYGKCPLNFNLKEVHMFFRIVVCLAVGLLTACSTARMAKLPGLEADSVSYKITEMPGSFSSKGNLVFGPYMATDISRGWIKGKSSGWGFGKLAYKKEDKAQDYSYRFKGKRSWTGECRSSKGQKELGIVTGGFYVDLSCGFAPEEKGASKWEFRFKGERSDRATGEIRLGKKRITVKPVDKMEGSPFKLAFNTGYYFYMGDKIVAAVDVVSKEGPVWFNNSLSQDERDKIAMAAAAFILNQNVQDN